ncbi:MAG: hypothetical protein Q7O66_20515, partial [Dehalococcoidia bacterium]|nr:hypothetical protein [Dehalococcoidia bacterium]
MTRIAEFQKKYPSIPKEVIVKWDVLNRGVSDTEDLDKVCAWQKAGAHYSYQSYDHNITLKEWVDKRPSRLKDGRILRAGKLMMKNGVGAAIHIDTRSPYQIKDLGNGNFGLFEGEEKVDVDVFFPHPKPRSTGELLTSNGTPVSNFVSQKRRCFSIMPVRYCEYFATGEQCKFCNFNVTQVDSGAIGLNRPVTISLVDTVDAYKVLSSDTRLLEGELEMGGFMKSENEGRIYFDFVEKLA